MFFRRLCDRHGALFWLNDRPDLALRAGADGVHVGQDDERVDAVRSQVGADLLDRDSPRIRRSSSSARSPRMRTS